MRWTMLPLVITLFFFLGCGEDVESPTGLDPKYYIPGRGDDGRELVYEWTDPDSGERVNLGSVSVSPDSRYAVFRVGYEDYLGKIDLVTKKTTVILYENTKSTDWSYDGQWIAFHHNGAGFFDISVIRPDGTGRRAVILDPTSDRGPLWFHRSNKFVYNKYYLSESTEEAAVYDHDTGEQVTITDVDDEWNVNPSAVSPDDEWISAVVWENKVIDDPWCDPDPEEVMGTPLAIIRTDGSECIWIIDGDEIEDTYCYVCDWSPDGRFILFSRTYEALGYMDRELWTYELGTGDFRQITMAPEDFPSDGDKPDYEEVRSADWASDGYIYFTNNLGLLYRIRAPIGSCKPVDEG